MQELKLTLKGVMLYERLSGKSYQAIDLEDPSGQTQILLLYALYSGAEWAKGGVPMRLDTFRLSLEAPKVAQDLLLQAQEIFQYNAQFAQPHEQTEPAQAQEDSEAVAEGEAQEQETPEQEEEKDVAKLTPLICRLCVEASLSPDYVLHQMELWELDHWAKALEEERKELLERERLWAFLQVLPHTSGDKIKEPSDLLPFAWELEAKKKEEELRKRKAQAFAQGVWRYG